MARREGQRIEVVTGGLDLATVDDRVPEPEEDVLDLAPDLRDRVQVPARPAPDGQRHVHALLGEPPVEIGAGELFLAGVERRLEAFAHRVQRHPGLPVAHVPERLLERALAAEVLDPRRLDLLSSTSRCGYGFGRALPPSSDLRVHRARRGYRRVCDPLVVRPRLIATRRGEPRLSIAKPHREPLRPDRADLRPVEPVRHRGHRVLRRGGAGSGGPVVELAVGRVGSRCRSPRRA